MFRKAGRISLFGVWLASFALLLQTVLPLLNQPASAANTAALPFAGDLVLCTAHGLAKITDAGAPHDDTDMVRTPKCPLCQVWQNLSNAMPTSAASLLGPAYAPDANARTPVHAALPRLHLDPLQARAPPLTA